MKVLIHRSTQEDPATIQMVQGAVATGEYSRVIELPDDLAGKLLEQQARVKRFEHYLDELFYGEALPEDET